MKKMSMYKNETAVSPIVATLVLIVVAVVGAVAVGTIMGTFSTQVSKQTSAGNAQSASQTTLLVAGSTTMQPIITQLAQWYSTNHTGVQVTVQGGGSGAGLAATSQGVADIGMMSEAMTPASKTAYPSIQPFQVAASGIVFIENSNLTLPASVDPAKLKTAYISGSTTDIDAAVSGANELVTRSDVSGTADTFGSYIGLAYGAIYNTPGSVKAFKSNSGVVGEVASNKTAAGFTDFDYLVSGGALTNSNVQIIPWLGYTAGSSPLWYAQADIKNGYNGAAGAKFPQGATRGWYLITNGAPTPLQKDFITFVQSPGVAALFDNVNAVHVSELVKMS